MTTKQTSVDWINSNIQRDAILDIPKICHILNPTIIKFSPSVHIWNRNDAFESILFDNAESLLHTRSCCNEFLQFIGETYEEYLERLKKLEKKNGKLKLIVKLIEGDNPLKPISLAEPKLSLPPVGGVDSTLATIDYFDCVISIISAAFHQFTCSKDHFISRTDLYVLNPRVTRQNTKILSNRIDVSRKIGRVMKECEYSLAFQYGGKGVVFLDGAIFGQDKHLIDTLLAGRVIFACIVKNPVSKIVSKWYEDYFADFGYENVTTDAVAYNDLLPPGTRSPYIFAEMISRPNIWCSKVFTYYKPLIPCSTVLRVEIPTDIFYLFNKIMNLVHACCTLSGDYTNSTVAPIVHAEYVAKVMLPDPHHISEKIRAILINDETRFQGSYNARRFVFD